MTKTTRSQAVTFVIGEQYGNETQELHVVGERDEAGQCSLSLHMMSDGWKLDLDEVDYFIESLADTMNQVKRTLLEVGQQVSLPQEVAMVDWTKPIRCKYDGKWRPARYLGPMKVRRGCDNRLVAVDHGDYETVVFTSDSGASHPARIITNVPVTRTVYLNFYDAGTDCMPICSVHASKELADSVKGGCMNKVACVEVTYTEGEGLA